MPRVAPLLRWYFVLSIVAAGCSQFKHQTGSGDASDWLRSDRVAPKIRGQLEEENDNVQAYFTRMHDLRTLQGQADILIQIHDASGVDVLAVRMPMELPKGVLSVPDMRRYFSLNRGVRRTFALAVVIAPPEFPAGDAKPDELSLIQAVDEALRNGGVKRRVYEIYNDHYCAKLDSAELN